MKKSGIIFLTGIIMIAGVGCAKTETPDSETVQTQTFLDVPMSPTDDSTLEELTSKKYMVAENISLRKMPSDFSPTSEGKISYCLIHIYTAIHGAEYEMKNGTDSLWCLIGYQSTDASYDTLGWVRKDELIEYTQDSKYLLLGPVSIRDGAVDLDSKEAIDTGLYRDAAYILEREGDTVVLETDGGNSCRVRETDLEYPEG